MPEHETPDEQSIEQLQERYHRLHTVKIKAETQRDDALRRLDDLKAQALKKYGTDDPAALQKLLDDMVAENARKRAAYQADLDKIEADLADVEQKFADPVAAGGGSPS